MKGIMLFKLEHSITFHMSRVSSTMILRILKRRGDIRRGFVFLFLFSDTSLDAEMFCIYLELVGDFYKLFFRLLGILLIVLGMWMNDVHKNYTKETIAKHHNRVKFIFCMNDVERVICIPFLEKLLITDFYFSRDNNFLLWVSITKFAIFWKVQKNRTRKTTCNKTK